MNCKQCGKMILGDAKFCGYCGYSQTTAPNNVAGQPGNVAGQPNNMMPNNNQNYNQTQNPVATEFASYQRNQNTNQTQYSNSYVNNEEEILLREYVGSAYDLINSESFSIPTFFLLPLYFLYRKMYLYGSLIFLLLIITAFIPLIGLFIPLISCIVFALKFKDIYMNFSRKKVNKIVNNRQLSFEQKLQLCRKKGGTNIALPIAIPFSIPIVFLILTPIIMNLLITPYTVGDYRLSLPNSAEVLEQTTNSMKFKYEVDGVDLLFSVEYLTGDIESVKEEFSTGSNNGKIELVNRKIIDGKQYVAYNVDVYGQKTGVVAIELDDSHIYMGVVTDKSSNTDIKDEYLDLFYNLRIKNTTSS